MKVSVSSRPAENRNFSFLQTVDKESRSCFPNVVIEKKKWQDHRK